MTDKELLELAAKAAGMRNLVFNEGETNAYYAGSLFYMTGEKSHLPWNPLTGDGDALRLAVKLRMDIEIRVNAGYVSVIAHQEPDTRVFIVEKPGDSVDALRRAITRAAAEIGARITTEDGK